MLEAQENRTTVISVVSGKGGVGKSVVAANLALTWAHQGYRVALVDADVGQGSCSLLLGSHADHLALVCPSDEAAPLLDLDARMSRLTGQSDFVVIDAPAGLGSGVRWALDRSDAALLVVVDEPTAVADAYALCKTVWTLDPGYPLAAAVNLADSSEDAADVVARFSALTDHFLNRKVLYTGWVPFSREMRQSVREQTPAVVLSQELMDAFADLAERIRCGVFQALAPIGLN